MASVPSVQILASSIDENLSEYQRQTTIHGVKYLADRSRSLAERIFWIITFTLAILLFGHFVYKIGGRWIENEVIQIERNTPRYIFEIPFPAVTICPQIKYTKEKLDLSKYSELYGHRMFTNDYDINSSYYSTKLFMASQICAPHLLSRINPTLHIFMKENMIYWIDALMDMSPSFSQVCSNCRFNTFQNTFHFPNNAISTVITNEGLCFTFNTIDDILREDSLHKRFKYHNITTKRNGWHPETGYTKGKVYPFKGVLGVNRGLQLELNANLSDTKQYCHFSNVGYKIALHSPSTYPQMYENFIEFDYGEEYKLSVIPKSIETSNDLRSVSPDVRQCYFNDERKLQLYTFYNQQNCQLECYANYTKHKEGGVPFSSPRDSKTPFFVMYHKNYGWGSLNEYKFLHEHFNRYGYPKNLVNSTLPNCNCLPECNGIYYDHKIMKTEKRSVLNLEEVIHTRIEIAFSEPTFNGLIRVPGYTFESMLSDFGGLLGLFLGGSVLSLFELFYFAVIRNFFKSSVTENQS